jgi:lysozyme
MPKGTPPDLSGAMETALRLFRTDLARYEKQVADAIKVPVAQHEFDAAVSFHFNTGAIGKASWVKKLNAGDRKGAASGFMAWSKPPEIIDRRKAEQRLFRDGTYPDGKIPVWGASTTGRVIWTRLAGIGMDEALRIMGRPVQPRLAPKPTPVTLNQPSPVSGVSRRAVGAGAGFIAAAGIALAAKWDQFTAWLAALF